MKVTAIVPAAGLGLRLNSKVAKPLLNIDSQPILIHTLKTISSHPLINNIILGFNKNDLETVKSLVSTQGIRKIYKIIEGGSTRKQTVKNALSALPFETDLVLIHDGVRPFVEDKVLSSAIDAASKYGAAVAGVPVKSTIKRINLNELEVDATLRRNEVWEIQTPQVFKKDIIIRAYSNIDNIEAPDDAFLVERMGHKVMIVLGSYFNIKITTFEDLVFAESIYGYLKEKDDEKYKSRLRI